MDVKARVGLAIVTAVPALWLATGPAIASPARPAAALPRSGTDRPHCTPSPTPTTPTPAPTTPTPAPTTPTPAPTSPTPVPTTPTPVPTTPTPVPTTPSPTLHSTPPSTPAPPPTHTSTPAPPPTPTVTPTQQTTPVSTPTEQRAPAYGPPPAPSVSTLPVTGPDLSSQFLLAATLTAAGALLGLLGLADLLRRRSAVKLRDCPAVRAGRGPGGGVRAMSPPPTPGPHRPAKRSTGKAALPRRAGRRSRFD